MDSDTTHDAGNSFSRGIVANWLDNMSYSIATRDLNSHMNLISKRIMVLGIGDQVIDYEGWYVRRRNELAKNLLKRIKFFHPEIIDNRENRITFKVTENMKSNSGQIIELEEEIVLTREEDKMWRVTFITVNRINLN